MLFRSNDSLIEMGGLVEQAIKNTMKMIVDGEDLLDIARGDVYKRQIEVFDIATDILLGFVYILASASVRAGRE